MAVHQPPRSRTSSCPAGLFMSIGFLLLNAQFFAIQGRQLLDWNQAKDLPMHTGTIKTLEASNGDVFDCVDIFKQPAFAHPLLKDHKIEMKPPGSLIQRRSSKISEDQPTTPRGRVAQHASIIGVQCPEGSVPIIRLPKSKTGGRGGDDIFKKLPSIISSQQQHANKQQQQQISEKALAVADEEIHEHALVKTNTSIGGGGGSYTGARATMDVWNPAVNDEGGASFSELGLVAEVDKRAEAILAGWMVNRKRYGDTKTRLFTSWLLSVGGDSKNRTTATTGCYNIDCPGFVVTNNRISLDAEVDGVSIYNGPQYVITVEVAKDNITNHWWLTIENETIGYWPGEIFSYLRFRPATTIAWGGEIIYVKSPTIQMGSGHFPDEGLTKSSLIGDLGVVVSGGYNMVPPDTLVPYLENPECYDVEVVGRDAVFYGGSGCSD